MEFKILGGGLSRPGRILQKNWDDNWHPVCDNFDNRKSRSLFGELVCRQNGFAKAARTTRLSKETESGEICRECWKDFAIVGISCKTEKGETKCDYTQSHYAGSGSCIKGKSDLLIQCEDPQSTKGDWSSWSEWSQCYEDNNDYFKQRSRTCYDDGKRAFCESGTDFELKPGCLCVKAKENAQYNLDYYSDSSDSLDYDYSDPLPSSSDTDEFKMSSFESAPSYSYYYSRRRRAVAARSTFVKPPFCKKYDFHELYSLNSESPSFVLRNPDLSTEENPVADDFADVEVNLSSNENSATAETDALAKGGFGNQTTIIVGIIAFACVVALVAMFGIKRKKSRENRSSTLDDEIKRPSESIGLIVPKPDESKNPSKPSDP